VTGRRPQIATSRSSRWRVHRQRGGDRKEPGIARSDHFRESAEVLGAFASGVLTHNAYPPTVNVHVEGGAADRQTAMNVATHVNDAVNKSTRGFRYSSAQQHTMASHAISKASRKNA
jgi:hypothetical protein